MQIPRAYVNFEVVFLPSREYINEGPVPGGAEIF